MHRKTFTTSLLLSLLVILGAACTRAYAGVDPTSSPVPSTLPVTASVTKAVIPSPTETPAPRPVMLTFSKNAFCRKGPGVEYFDVGSFNQGDTAQAEGRNQAGLRWWYMLMADGKGHCWVSGTTVLPDPSAEALPVQAPQAMLPETPSDFSIVERICKGGGFAVTLGWSASGNADGYYVYLNGEQIQEIKKPGQTSYVNKAPMNQPVSYALEAYNDIGYGESVTVDDPGCP